ncbi:MAG: aminotransferase [Candidatus Lindowbacteria bacterium RIFCSPLOWO2_12_FULL_62_27]|nr:MAG: aminotransferase [Candidatus Lindowbacteria bacterium RIFCSPLOWO2_12_FULL_62_27]OGH64009.1 MAG: aminotransferase [Candidatus Lindowbacteria bacterium RIFCSPLOWO2_02_FULL_62_12]
MRGKIKIEWARRMDRLPPYLFATINELRHKMRQANRDVIDLAMGNPDRPTPPHIVKKMIEAVSDGRNHRYSVSKGIFNLRRDVAIYYKNRYGVELNPNSEVVACIGSKEGISHMALAMLGPGDTALVPSPFFPIHVYTAIIAGANVITVPMNDPRAPHAAHEKGDGSFHVDGFLGRLSMAMKQLHPTPKMLYLNFPHNPTAYVVEPDFYTEVVKLARKNGICIIQDFAYKDIVFDGYRSPSILAVPGAKDIAVEFFTLSKSYNMAGWRMGFCVGNEKMCSALAKIKGYYDYGHFQAVQIAAIVALRSPQEIVSEIAKIYERRRNVLIDGLNRIGWPCSPPKASMFAWVPMPRQYRKMGSMKFSLMLLEKSEVAVSPGKGFGDDGEGFLRIALVENEQRIRQAVRQIDHVLNLRPKPEPVKKSTRSASS